MIPHVLATDALRDAVAAARRRGYAVRVRDLGDWGARVRPCAELDARARTIVLDRRLLLSACERLGARAAADLAVAAIAHELAHAADPHAPEAAVRAAANRAAGADLDARVREALA